MSTGITRRTTTNLAHERRTGIVVGASSGLGYSIAEQLLQRGWHLVVAARRTERMAPLKEQYGAQVTVRRIDVNALDAAENLLAVAKEIGKVDLYFHVAGIGKQNTALDAATEMATVETNVAGFTRCITAMFNYLAANGGGQIAAISSIAGTKGLGPAPSYSATKAFQNTYLESLEQLATLRHADIRITDIRPGFVRTALLGDNPHYPMLMNADKVAAQAVKAVLRKQRVCIIDARYRVLVFFWRLIPRWLWCRLRLVQ